MVMKETASTFAANQPPVISTPAPQEPNLQKKSPRRFVRKCFVGPSGLRSGWRLTIYLLIVSTLIAGLSTLARALHQASSRPLALEANFLLSNEGVAFVVVLFAGWVMSRLERRKIADYGFPLQRAFRSQFWQGVVMGFLAMSALLVCLRWAGVFHFGTIGLHGFEVLKYAALWGIAFLLVGLFEEFFFRGYALFTLSSGIKFWPSALLVSAIFGLLHHNNPGESWAGAFEAGVTSLLFCFLLRRTGNLWMPIGFHAAWDWGETFFYGVPDSGYPAKGHLFNPTFSGPVWLTGGSAGPEGGWLSVLLLTILWIGLSRWLGGKTIQSSIQRHA
jgi:uncharacterized protein